MVHHLKKHEGSARQVEVNVDRWISSPAGWTKINVDGALGKLDDKSAVAAVVGRSNDQSMGASSVVFWDWWILKLSRC